MPDETRQLDLVRHELEQEFSGLVPAQRVHERFDEIVAGFERAPLRTYVPVLVHRQGRQALRAEVPAAP